MFMPNLDSNLPTPLYEQLYEQFKQEIERGHFKNHKKLPAKRILANNLDISINTVSKAYEQLLDEGYITSIERSGYYVENIENQLVLKERKVLELNDNKDIRYCKYDLSYNKVDNESFPFNSFRKIAGDVINEYDNTLLEMTSPKGLEVLRKHICNYVRDSRGINTSLENIIISSGTEYLFQILFQILDNNLTYAVENPGYERLSNMFEIASKKYCSLSLDSSGINVKELENRGANIACITPSHQFPMGIIMPIGRRMELLKWANEGENKYIVEDDYDSEFKYKGKPIPSLKSFDHNDKVIYMGSFSKSIAPSMRISYMILPNKLVDIFREKMPFFQCSVPTLSQMMLSNFIESGKFERHLNRMRKVYKRKREELVSAINKYMPRCKIIGEEAGVHLIITIDNKTEENEIIEHLLNKSIKLAALRECYSEKVEDMETMLILGFGGIGLKDISPAIYELSKALSEID